ncbi:MAG: tRNA (adenosine(37)-N6)-dimethylallyltransferase MiaA [Campylobacterota bacterium]|nr:tRNA (adenosine(37)-N6)-dimethylallyltransferase MiaA [Campylobacterota bacterium]
MYKEIAIIAPTASGKTKLSISLADKLNAVILSLDSLAIYKEIDIASAKPTIKERQGIIHFGIDKILPNENYDVIEFIQEYEKAKQYAQNNNKNLIIVGGTGFYLKSMIDGLSKVPKISQKTRDIVRDELKNINKIYEYLMSIDKNYMSNISKNDKYRVEKAYELYLETNMIPSEFFESNKPEAIIKDIDIYEIETDVEILRDRIKQRTNKMILDGIVDEVISLEQKYSRGSNCMSSIGIIETFEYLDGKIDKKQLSELISIHTAQLAKRQRTFNKSQFKNVYKNKLENLESKIISTF